MLKTNSFSITQQKIGSHWVHRVYGARSYYTVDRYCCIYSACLFCFASFCFWSSHVHVSTVCFSRDTQSLHDSLQYKATIQYIDFLRKKIKNAGLVKRGLFSLEIQQRTCINLHSFESSMKWPFTSIFPSRSARISDNKVTANARYAKNSLQSPDFEAMYHFSVNSYHTSRSVVVRSIF